MSLDGTPARSLRPRLFGGVLLALGLVLAVVVVPQETLTVSAIALQPSALPTLASLGIALCGLILLLRPVPDGGATPVAWPLLTIVAFALGTYVAAAQLGYAVAAPAVILAMMLVMGERRPFVLLVGTAGGPAIIWFIFGSILGRPLP